MQKLIRIVAAVVDTKKAVLYKKDGTTVEILQGDTRLRPLLEHITPLLSTQGYADVDLSTENSYKEFEKKQTGVRFFRIAKEKLKNLFGGKTEPVKPTVVGMLPSTERNKSAIEEIMQHATPVQAAEFSEDSVAVQRPTVEADGRTPNDSRPNEGVDDHFDKSPDTIVAVTKTGKVVPGVERIKSQITNAAKTGNTKGMTIFFERAGRVIERRGHTIEDLLRFMERGDLPVADDGSIIIYKKLYRRDGHYVDPHTQKVKQKIGSYVHMDEKMVDPNRRNECSNGLHVARRGYVGSFSGDVIVLAKVRPEDVIAVPDYDANKMRVCGYHILFELSPAQYTAINRNRPISEAEGGTQLLGKAISGDHVGVLEHVKITQAKGGGLEITPANEKPKAKAKKDTAKKKAASKKTKPKPKKKAVKTVKPLEAAVVTSDKPVSVKKLAAKVTDQNVSLSEEVAPQVTQTDVVKALWDKALGGNKGAARELLDFKKKAKKGWKVWGLPDTAGDTLKALLN